MTKKITFLITAALMLLTMIVSPGRAVGQTRTEQTASYGFETGDTGWTATSFVTNNTAITAHGGSKYGATNGGSTANVTYDTKVANPQSLTCYYSKTTTNTNAVSHFEIQVSTNNSTWTTVESGLGMNEVTKGTWYELTADLSSYSDVYVRVYYTGTSAVRALDDITLTYDDGQSPSTDPEISFSPASITLDEVLVGNQASTTFSVSQANLTSGITLSVDNGSLSPSSIAQGAAATAVTWTYTPTTAGAISATVTATSGETTETLAISGTAIAPVEGYDVDFEYATNMYPNWTFDNMTTYQTGSITAHGGTYYGTTGGKTTASITTTLTVANPGTLTCYVSKQSNNTTSSTWYIQVSSDGSSWTEVESQSATSMSQGSWVEFSADLSSYTDVYVRVYYNGSTAIRNIDDLTLTTAAPSNIFTVTYDGNGNTSGSIPTDDNEYESGAEVTVLGNTGDLAKAGYVWAGWNTKADGTGTDRAAGSTFNISGNTTLYAKWVEKTITKLSYTGTLNKTDYFEGDVFVPTGLTVTATYNDASTEDVTSQVTWTPSPLTAGTTSVTGSFMGQEIVITGLTVAGANITLSTDNSPFTSTSSSNNTIEQVTLDGIEYQNYGGYKYNSYLSINKSINGYLGNNTKLCGNIKKIVVEFSSNVISKFTMYEGATALAETTSIAPTTDENTATYTFSGNTGYFKYKLTTTGTYCNIVSIKIYLNECVQYTVTGVPSPAAGGTVAVATSPLSEGDATTVTATPNAGYHFVSWDVSGEGSSLSSTTDNPTTLTMGTENATVTATFEETVTYDIVVNDATEHGSIEADKEYAAAGETVTITATADNGFELDEWIVEDEDENPIEVTGTNPATFVMPAKDVLVSATFTAKPTYAITQVVTPVNGGTVATDETAWEGKDVTVLVEPIAGYNLVNIAVSKTDDPEVTTVITGNVTDGFTFTMPAYPVTVTATFAAADVLTGSEVYAAMPNSKTYKEWTLVKTYATYKGQSNDVQEYIQLRNSNPSGIVTTTSTGYARKVSVTYASSNTNGRYLTVYGKNTPYEGPADLYDDNKKGTSLGTITYNTNDVSDELTITGDYQYIGLLASGAMYFEPIIITWDPVTFYEVIFDEAQTGGTISVSPTTATEGETITLTATPAEHYEFTSWTVEDENSDPVELTGTNPATFEMPASDVTVEATFTALPQYDITIPVAIEDYIMVDATGNKAYAGETVTISVVETPAGKVLSTLTVIGGTSGNEIEISPEVSALIDEYTFEMPAENVTINATFGDLPKYTVTFYVNGTLDNNLTINNITPGNSINLPESSTLILPEGYSFVGWATEGSTVAVDNPYIPANSMALYSLLQDNNAQVTYSYVKVTESLADWSGDYLIVYTTGNLAFDGSLETLDASGNTIAVNITNNCIAANATTDASKFTIEEFEDGYSIKSARNKYIGNASNSNGLTASDNQMENTISYNEGNIDIVSDGGAYLRYNSTSGQERFRYFKSSSYTNQKAIQLYKRTANDVPSFNTITEVSGTTTIGDDIPVTTCVIVKNGAVLTFHGENQGSAANLVVQDGGQLIHTNNLAATLQKDITAWTTKDVGGWYFIASPVDGAAIDESFDQAIAIDLFKYDEQDAYWYSYLNNGQNLYPFSTLTRGVGYLHASESQQTLNFAGMMVSTNDNISLDLSYACTYADVKGYNLMGNPFSCNLTAGDMVIKREGDDDISVASCLVINGGSDYETCNLEDGDVIKPGQGFFIQATKADQAFIFNRTSSSKDDLVEKGFIRIAAGNDNYMDKAYVHIKNGNTLRKMNIANSTIVYVMNDGDDYAAARVEELAGTMPVHFKAVEDGEFTITINAKNIEASTLILFDDFTGEQIDLLETPTYAFKASAEDEDNRFKLIFDFNNNYNGVDDNYVNGNFAYQNGDELFVSGDGTLQVFDVMGRFVMSKEIHGNESISVSAFETGVYMLRFVGENNMTQKIVVR